MNEKHKYPDDHFLRDFDDYLKAVNLPPSPYEPKVENKGFEIANVQFSKKYGSNKWMYSYRFNRFVCILNAIHGDLPKLIADKIAKPEKNNGGSIPEHLLLALHSWYCSVSDDSIKQSPEPDWPSVLNEYDRLDKLYPDK